MVGEDIRKHYALGNGSYGRPRMTMELREAGLDVGERRVGRLMKDNGIRPVRIRRHKMTTDSHRQPDIAANLLASDFPAEGPDREGTGNISSIWTAEGWLSLADVIARFSCRVIGWAAGDRMKKIWPSVPWIWRYGCVTRRPAAFSTPIVAASMAPMISRKSCWPMDCWLQCPDKETVLTTLLSKQFSKA